MRYLASHILEDLKNKMVFISGPRQVGKTSLSESLLSKLASDQYYSWDRREHREVVRKGTWDRSKKLVVFDELHKFRGWKSWLKGIYDTEKRHGPALLVTGSAKLNVFRHGGDSLLGRYHHYRLHPFSLKEWKATTGGDVQTGLKMLLERSGFPEPLFSKKMTDIDRWRKERLELVLRDDVISLENIRNLSGLESLMDLLSQRAGGCLSYQSLAEDLSVSGPTVKSWVELLERMYMVYRVPPYYRSLQRATRKEPKIYLYDYSEVVSPGTRLENLVANHLLREVNFLEDTKGARLKLYTLRDKEKREIDFVITEREQPIRFIEVKQSDTDISGSLFYYKNKFPKAEFVQVVQQLHQGRSKQGIRVIPLTEYLLSLAS